MTDVLLWCGLLFSVTEGIQCLKEREKKIKQAIQTFEESWNL